MPPLLHAFQRHAEVPIHCPSKVRNTDRSYHRRKVITDTSLNLSTSYDVLFCYYGSDVAVRTKDVTLVTFVSVERLDFLEALLRQWSGRISLAYFARNEEDIGYLNVQVQGYEEDMRRRLTVHIMMRRTASKGGVSLPTNALRNIATVGIETSHMFHVDIDFVPSFRMRETILDEYGDLLSRNGTDDSQPVFVVPSFEIYGDSPPASEFHTLFETMSIIDVKRHLTKGYLQPFQSSCSKCQGATNYTHFTLTSSPYSLSFPPPSYHPYLITPTFISLPSSSSSPSSSSPIPFLFYDSSQSGFGRTKPLYYFLLHDLFPKTTYTVLPSVAILHRFHPLGFDAMQWATSKEYRREKIKGYEDRKGYWVRFLKEWRESDQMESQSEVNVDVDGIGLVPSRRERSREELVRQVQRKTSGSYETVVRGEDVMMWMAVVTVYWMAVVAMLMVAQGMNWKGRNVVGVVVMKTLQIQRAVLPYVVLAMYFLTVV